MNSRQHKFMDCLLKATTTSEAIKMAGISRSSAYGYLKIPYFMEELKRRRSEILDDTCRYLQSNLSDSAKVLIDIVNDSSTPSAVRIQAINTVFSTVSKFAEINDIQSKLETLERIVDKNAQ